MGKGIISSFSLRERAEGEGCLKDDFLSGSLTLVRIRML
jgi:hypothetical protein